MRLPGRSAYGRSLPRTLRACGGEFNTEAWKTRRSLEFTDGHAGSELRGVREIPPAHGWAGTDSTPWTTVELWARPRRAEPELRAIPPTQHRRFRAQRRRSAATTVRAVARFRRPVR